MIDILNKLNATLIRSLFITLKVQDIHYLCSKSIPFTVFVILFFQVPMWSSRFSHPKVTTPQK